MMIFDDDDEKEGFSSGDFFGGDDESEEPPAPEPFGDEELSEEYSESSPQAGGDTWHCSCGQENVGDFCVACGKPKDQSEVTSQAGGDTWYCSCGQENVGDFCVAYGKPKDQSEVASQAGGDTWHCSRVQENIGDFCVRCGKSKQQVLKNKLRTLSNELDRQSRLANQNNITQPPSPPQTPPPVPPLSPPSLSPLTESSSNKSLIIGALAGLLLLGGGFFAFQNLDESDEDIPNTQPIAQENFRVVATYYVANCN